METFPAVPDWLSLWGKLARHQDQHWERVREPSSDFWAKRAKGFDKKVRKQAAQEGPDCFKAWLTEWFRARPGATVMDIGAGTGRWVEFLSPLAAKVVAVEPSKAMLEVLRENIASKGLDNVEIVTEFWPLETDPEPVDMAFASHAVYGVTDLSAFVRAMERAARQACVMLLRSPVQTGGMADACRRIMGQPFDSPNLTVGYNALLQMDILADVVVFDGEPWGMPGSDTMDEALADMKSRLGVHDTNEHDDYLRGVLRDSLEQRDGKWAWPADCRTALVHWDHTRFSINR